MCGIFGYLGNKQASEIIFQGLQRLEYRGYDSAGIAVKNGTGIALEKKKGRIHNLQELSKNLKGTLGIGHTRWATHGEPNDVNAHPHHSTDKKIMIVHNGIIENFSALKEFLNCSCISATDSEVLAHLIQHHYKGNLLEAVRLSLLQVEGTYGLAVMHQHHDEIIIARNGSPLVVGLGKNEYIISSDLAAIAPHTKKYFCLDDKQIGKLTPSGYEVKDLENSAITKELERITWDVKSIEKKGFSHFMLKEIFEQPASLKNCFRGRITNDEIKVTLNLDDAFIKSINRIILVGCGTSWHSALVAEYAMEKTLNIPVEVEYASEFRYRNPILHENDLVVVISQSGETADTLAALKEAKKHCKTIGIINVVGSTIAREAGSGIYIHAGPEIGVASTKAFTGQILGLLLLALYIDEKREKTANLKTIKDALDNLEEHIKAILEKNEDIKKIAEAYYNSTNFLFLGRGSNFPVALEGALKLKEISYIHAEGYPAAEMKHGPIALIDEHMPVVFIANQNGLHDKIISNMEEVYARKGSIIALTTDDRELKKYTKHIITVPETIDLLQPILNSIPLQLLAYHIAVLKNLDPDKPRNLAKSVTVE
ncbi:glutamine--fructose-6-phosphate transaminase (isomerizing) [Candidatus Woesearchaeota archaeon]|nr:MAG: glutamine--fructose-6-phosphate transaminase (isomerizing) [Candidatus Woesearchaeota archaeon]